MLIKFLLLGGVLRFFRRGGGVEVPFLFLWAWGFFRDMLCLHVGDFYTSVVLELKAAELNYERTQHCHELKSHSPHTCPLTKAD